MSDNSSIEWTDATLNIVTGCTEVSPGCDHCYAKTFAERWRGTRGHHFEQGFDVRLWPERVMLPLHWRKPKRIFVNSMADLFHEDVPDGLIGSLFDVMAKTPQHTYQILTKRHGRMRSLLNKWAAGDWTFRRHDGLWCGPLPGPLPNVHLGVSVEDQKWADIRIPALLETPAAIRFISAEPLLGHVRLAAPWLLGNPRLDWVIAGGESGPGARRCEIDWLQSLRGGCAVAGIPFFCKQLGSVLGKQLGAGLKGGDWDRWPEDLRVREFPRTAQAVTA